MSFEAAAGLGHLHERLHGCDLWCDLCHTSRELPIPTQFERGGVIILNPALMDLILPQCSSSSCNWQTIFGFPPAEVQDRPARKQKPAVYLVHLRSAA